MREILNNPWVLAALSGLAGAILTILVRRVLNKRGLFTYSVVHNHVGISTDDAVFGSVKVTWNDNAIANLYISTIEVRNESLRDFEGVTLRVWTTTTSLLTERAEILGTTHVLAWTREFAETLAVPAGKAASPEQLSLVYGRREYAVPTMNRGAVIRLTFLNAANSDDVPQVWLNVVHPGVRVKYRALPQQFLGVPQPAAALVGFLSGLIVVPVIVTAVDTAWLTATLAFLYGAMLLLPGALLLKLWRWARDMVGG